MPARTAKQRQFMGAELERKREGKETKTGMSESQLEDFASKPTRADREPRAGSPAVHQGEAGDKPDRP